MNDLSLFHLADEFRSAADRLADMDLDDETIRDTLEGMQYPVEEKAKNVAAFVKNLEASAEAIKHAEEDMAKRRKAIESRAASLRRYLLENMDRCNITKIDSPHFCISIRENPAAVVIDAAGQIPCEYYVYPEAPEPYPDKKLIAKAIKDGFEVPGAHLSKSKRVVIA